MLKREFFDAPFYTIFILILIISANFLGSTFPCRVQKLLSENVYIKHILGFFTMIFFVMISAPILKDSLFVSIISSIIMYIFFIFMTKTPIEIFIVIFILLMITYILILYLKQLSLDKDKYKDKEHKILIENVISLLYVIILLFTILGTLIYMGEKKIEYGKTFSYSQFFIGNPVCKNKSPTIPIFKALKHSFS